MAEKKFSLFGFVRKFIFQFVVVIGLFLIFATFVLPYFIPLEKVVPMEKVNEILGQQAGLKLELNGKTRVSILPFVGVSAKNINIQNIRDEFKNNSNVISAKKIDIKLSVFPLLFGNVVVKNILLDGANINVLKCNEKINVFSPENVAKIEEVKESDEGVDVAGYVKNFGIKNFAIKESNFYYHDCKTNTKYEVKGFDASISIPDFEKDIFAKFSMAVNGVKLAMDIDSSNLRDILEKKSGTLKMKIGGEFGVVKIASSYKFDSKFQTFFDKTTFEITAENLLIAKLAQIANIKNENLAKMPNLNVSINGKVDNTNFSLEKLQLKLENITLNGQNIAVKVLDRNKPQNISANGDISVEISKISALVSAMNLNLPIVKKYPSQINGDFAFNFGNNILKIEEKSSIKIDETVFNISLIADVMKQVKSFAFSASSKFLNVDEYLNLQNEKKEKNDNKNEPYVPIAQRFSKETISMPVFKNMIIDASLAIEKLIAYEIEMSNFSSKLKVRDGLISNKLSTNVFQGSTTVDFNASEKDGKLAGLSFDASVNNFEIKKIIQIAKFLNFAEGKINGNVTFNASASNVHDVVMKGVGVMDFKSENFTAVGIDLDNLIKDVMKDYKSLLSSDAVSKYISPSKKTTVDSIIFNGKISQGVFNNEKMFAKKGEITLDGHGTVDLNNESINYTILPKNGSQVLPAIVVKRTISDPVYTIDPSLYVQAQVKNAVREQIKTNPVIQEKISQFNNAINNFKL